MQLCSTKSLYCVFLDFIWIFKIRYSICQAFALDTMRNGQTNKKQKLQLTESFVGLELVLFILREILRLDKYYVFKVTTTV